MDAARPPSGEGRYSAVGRSSPSPIDAGAEHVGFTQPSPTGAADAGVVTVGDAVGSAAGAAVLSWRRSTSPAVRFPLRLRCRQPQPGDLRGEEVAARLRLLFAMGMGDSGMQFTIDGKAFDSDRVDQAVEVGTVEEWTLTNASSMDHPIHLHVWPMQVVEQGGEALDSVVWQAVVYFVPGGEVTVRIACDRFPGRAVYHCPSSTTAT